MNPLDSAFAGLGLPGSSYLVRGHQLHGALRGRHVDIYCSERRVHAGSVGAGRYHGHLVEIFVASSLRTRCVVSTPNGVARWVDGLARLQPLGLDDAAYRHLFVRARDVEWARRLVAHPPARRAIWSLIPSPNPHGVASVQIQPERAAFTLRTHLANITPQAVELWVSSLLDLTESAEGLPGPRIVSEQTALERWSREHRSLTGVAGAAAVLGGCFVASLGIVGCLVLLSVMLARLT